jgi:CRP-like cAMP-binding protein
MANQRARPALSVEIEEFPAFRRLGSQVLDRLVEALREQTFEPGEVLVRQGRPGDHLLVLMDGTARGTLEREGDPPLDLAELRRGDVVGEMALVTDEPRSVTVRATSRVVAQRLDAAAFRQAALRDPEVGVVLTHLVADRLGHLRIDGLGGKKVGSYVVVQTLARGATSVVYEAREAAADRRVALKMMSHRLIYDPPASQRFLREADILLKLDHPHVVRLLQRFEAYRTHFLAMEYCDGPDLEVLIRRHAPFPVDDVRAILGQIASGLCYLRDEGVIHRDLKPNNVLSTADGRLKLSDFGLAKPLGWSDVLTTTSEHSVLGTPLYMAPEQITGGRIDATIDDYALGCILHELLTGKPLFVATSVGQLMVEKLGFVAPEARADRVPEDLQRLLATCLAPRPADRTPDLERVASWAAPLSPRLRAH